MLTPEAIQQAVQRIVTAAQPNRVILFGSYARGEANEDSDLDLLVIERDLPADQVANEMARLRLAVGSVGVGVDILVYSEAEFERRKNWSATPIYWAQQEGRVVYERPH